MQARILIKRRFKRGNREQILALLRQFRSAALSQPGYISGETLSAGEDPQVVLVIGTWDDLASWKKWETSTTRKALEQMLDAYQEEPTEYQEFVVGVADMQ
jgi:antibiotic biosynthesis monooxygenase (ABM) superfamily enzyme